MKDRPIPRRIRVRKTPPVDLVQRMIATGEAWRRDNWTSRYAAALLSAGVCER